MIETLYIISGLLLLLLTNILVTFVFLNLYFKIVKEKKSLKEMALISLFLSGVNYLIQIAALIIFGSIGVYGFFILESTLSVIGYVSILKFHYRFQLLQISVITISLTILLSPIWLKLFGIL